MCYYCVHFDYSADREDLDPCIGYCRLHNRQQQRMDICPNFHCFKLGTPDPAPDEMDSKSELGNSGKIF
jgi:hypothetical protein